VGPTLCPTPRDLELLLAEGLDEPSRHSTERHVESCEVCQARLDHLVLDLQRDLQDDWPGLPAALGHAPSRAARETTTEDASAFAAEFDSFLRRSRLEARIEGVHARRAATDVTTTDESLPHVAGYEILGEIGRGAVGIVYRARHLELNRLVAIKMILAGPLSSPKAQQRFRLESQAIARLRHPRIVQVHDVGEQDGRLYLVLELVEGGNLATSIAEGPRAAAKAARIVAELAEAVEHAHTHGVIHRDLKPANVLFHDPSRSGHALSTDVDGECQLKITDFGLAKVTSEDAPGEVSVTQSGEFLGTPSYTAPEQARGDAKLVGPQADVYSLGAILYELLTGRPPFQGASVVETLMQVAHHEVVPAVRLVPGVPRDLDTVCAKCLQKDPERRYQTANDLARDLRRFLAGEPILARPIGRFERTARWIRRRPGDAAGIAGGVLLVALLAGAGVWSAWRDATLERAVQAEFSEASRHAQASDWRAARAALERARVRLDAGGNDELESRLARSTGDIETAQRLEAIRLGRAGVEDGQFDVERNRRRADESYAAEFARAGFGDVFVDATGAAAGIARSDIRRAWIGALDDWSACQASVSRADRRRTLLELARRVEDDPTGALTRWRDPDAWADPAALSALVASPPAQASIELLIAIGDRLRQLRGDAVPLLERVQSEHPDDFWANFALADALVGKAPARAARYYQAALALRPDSATAANNLGRCLAVAGSPLEALPHLERAVRIDPQFGLAHSNLGNVLTMLGRHDEAIAAGLEAVRLEPERAEALNNLGHTYAEAGRSDDTLVTYERAAALDPKSATAHANLCTLLRTKGRLAEALEHGLTAVELDPQSVGAANNYGLALATAGRHAEGLVHLERANALEPDHALSLLNLSSTLRALGRYREAVAASERLLKLDAKSAKAHGSLAMAYAEIGRLDEAVASIAHAAELEPEDARIRQNQGILLQSVGRIDEAIAAYRRALELAPRTTRLHLILGNALLVRGDWDGARSELQTFLEESAPADPLRSGARASLQRIEVHVELEARLADVVAGTATPRDPADALALAGIAAVRERNACAARLASAAFAMDPALADDVHGGPRLEAARCAALAGAGIGIDAQDLDESARRGWRDQSRAWLRADLERFASRLDDMPRKERILLAQTLSRWRFTVEFEAVRGDVALAALPAAERAEWNALWGEVDVVRARAGREP